VITPPRIRAERCFALARSTTFEAEREAAIRKGLAICERAGLDASAFEIPGRMKPEPASWFRETLFDKPKAPAYYSQEEIEAVLRRYWEQSERMRADFFRTGA